MKLIDFHAHVIPWADHGSSSIETSLFQLQSAKYHGVERIIATPHFYPQYENVERFISRRNECFDRLKEYLSDDLPNVTLGAEVLICDNIESMPHLEKLCVEGTRILLLELPFTDFSSSFIYTVKTLIKNGYTIVLAHADRYNPENINKLVSAGAKIQLNVNSLSGLFIPHHLKEWIKGHKVVALGSDIHHADKTAYKKFTKAIKHIGDDMEFIISSSNELLDTNISIDSVLAKSAED